MIERGEAEFLLTKAQMDLDRHQVSSSTGCCLFCGAVGVCVTRALALKRFRDLHKLGLPRRTKGATMPGLIGAPRHILHGDFKWLV